MSDLSSMIDDTTERLLRKIDNWEVPQSDKKYVTIEKEVWESTLKASMDRAGKIETLQKQLDIAVNCLKGYANSSEWWTTENGDKCEYATDGYEEAQEALQQIEELNK